MIKIGQTLHKVSMKGFVVVLLYGSVAIKGYKLSPHGIWDLSCLQQVLTCFHVSDYNTYWNNEDESLAIDTLDHYK